MHNFSLKSRSFSFCFIKFLQTEENTVYFDLLLHINQLSPTYVKKPKNNTTLNWKAASLVNYILFMSSLSVTHDQT